ncbi:MAG: HPF/RaiA family ribosome-associated protein [Chloroflexota bacterium]
MQTKVTFRHFKSQHPELHVLAVDAADNFQHFHDNIIATNVEFINDEYKIVEFTVHLNGGTLVSKDSSDDFHKSLNAASDKMVRQLNKWKTKHSDVRPRNAEIANL